MATTYQFNITNSFIDPYVKRKCEESYFSELKNVIIWDKGKLDDKEQEKLSK